MFETLATILAIIFALITIFFGARIILKRKLSKLLFIPFFVIVFLLQYVAGFLIFTALLEIFPYSKHTPCFVLNATQCEKRQDCSIDLLPTGSGKDDRFCFKK